MRAAPHRQHDPASQARYQEIKQLARSQRRILSGTPGTLKTRTQSGKQYWVREHIRVDGKKDDEYIGAADAKTVTRLRDEVELARALATGSGHLRLFGYQRIDRKPAAVLEVLFNRGLFAAGIVLVGSHAYGSQLNDLGVIAPASLKPSADEASVVEVLVPDGKPGEGVAVEELGAHAQAIPHLDFLLAEPADSVALSPNQVIPVRIPSPERFVLHMLLSSQSRSTGKRDKIRKDLQQAAILAAAIEEETPGRVNDAFRRMPVSARTRVKRGALAASRLLEKHPEAQAALLRIAGR